MHNNHSNFLITFLGCLLLLCPALLQGCDNSFFSPRAPGEVARVNGRPITIKQLDAMYDSLTYGFGGDQALALEPLRQAYGRILGELIVQELIEQQLAKKKLQVTPEEVQAEEDALRADYTPESFDRFLLEEGPGLENLRELLRRRVAVQKFINLQLRPGIELTAEEAERYYQANEGSFKLQESYKLMKFSGISREDVQAAAKQYLQIFSPQEVMAAYPDVHLRNENLTKDRLPPDFVKALEKMRPGQISPLLESGNESEYVVLLLLQKDPPRQMSRAEVYPTIENMLLEDKVQKAFDAWLEKALAKAKIEVSVHLVPKEMMQ